LDEISGGARPVDRALGNVEDRLVELRLKSDVGIVVRLVKSDLLIGPFLPDLEFGEIELLLELIVIAFGPTIVIRVAERPWLRGSGLAYRRVSLDDALGHRMRRKVGRSRGSSFRSPSTIFGDRARPSAR